MWRESPGSASGQCGCISSVRSTLRLSNAAGATPGTAQAAIELARAAISHAHAAAQHMRRRQHGQGG